MAVLKKEREQLNGDIEVLWRQVLQLERGLPIADEDFERLPLRLIRKQNAQKGMKDAET